MTAQQAPPFSGLASEKEIIEALLFATDEPLTLRQVIEIFGDAEESDRNRRITPELILSVIEDLNREYSETGRTFRIVKIAGGYQFATQPQFGVWLGRMVRERSKRKLSVSALESLAVIAYKQPVTKPEIEAIRGVNADYVLHSLLERNLVAIVGRAATPGRPLLYGTTKEFPETLRHQRPVGTSEAAGDQRADGRGGVRSREAHAQGAGRETRGGGRQGLMTALWGESTAEGEQDEAE